MVHWTILLENKYISQRSSCHRCELIDAHPANDDDDDGDDDDSDIDDDNGDIDDVFK